ncbi:MAG: Ku protein, partial [Deltaproteobacteria bacterium]|nr:Ku protein [Deltaproteobacteria bacterium]
NSKIEEGEEIAAAPDAAPAGQVIDLMEALKASLGGGAPKKTKAKTSKAKATKAKATKKTTKKKAKG